MCTQPILIKNKSRYYSGRVDALPELHDVTSQYLYVPCGVCPDCCRKKQMYLIQRCQLEAMENYLFMFTLTYSDDMIGTIDVNGRKLKYVPISDFQNMFKRLRKLPQFNVRKYLFVTEYGGKKHRPHIHGILFVPKDKNDSKFTPLNYEHQLFELIKSEWRRNVGSTRNPIWQPCFVYVCKGRHRNYDLHYINPSLSEGAEGDVSFYVTKYVLKFDDYVERLRKALYINCEPDVYHKVWNLVKPRVITSKGFGVNTYSLDYVRDCIEKYSQNTDFPCFRNPTNGKTFPLSPYLYNKFGTLSDKYHFFYKQKNPASLTDSFSYQDDFLKPTEYKDKLFSDRKNLHQICQKNGDEFDLFK